MDQIVFDYAPIIFVDKKEPFGIKKVGVSQYFIDGAKSESFNRKFDFKNHDGAVSVLEYAYYFDYDIQHLYDLEHIWIYIDKEGQIAGAEGSFHGRFLNAMNRTFDGLKIKDGKHIVMYSQPGKHAFLSDPRLMYLYSELYSSCDRLAGIGGLDAPERYIKDIECSESDNARVIQYIKDNFSFVPSMEFIQYDISKEDYMPWGELAKSIPIFITEELGKILS